MFCQHSTKNYKSGPVSGSKSKGLQIPVLCTMLLLVELCMGISAALILMGVVLARLGLLSFLTQWFVLKHDIALLVAGLVIARFAVVGAIATAVHTAVFTVAIELAQMRQLPHRLATPVLVLSALDTGAEVAADEAVAVGAALGLRPGDRIMGTHRSQCATS